jgi:SAM-dependent methyltransferase
MMIQKLKDIGFQSVVHKPSPISKAGWQLGPWPIPEPWCRSIPAPFPDPPKKLSRGGRNIGRLRTLACAPAARPCYAERLLDRYREQIIETGRGLVLEIGVGSGLNLPLYGPAVTRVVGLDPSTELLRLASKRGADAVVPVSRLQGSAEHVPFADAVFDTIVMIWTLCSIPNPIAALTKMRRVLGPGGRLLFVEHGLSPEIRTALAALVDAVLEAYQRGLSPRSQDWRTDPHGGIPDRCRRDRLREGTKAPDIHVSGFGDELILPTSVSCLLSWTTRFIGSSSMPAASMDL